MLKRVVILGADGRTPLDWILQISKKYPFVEWGVRADKLQRGGAKYPSLAWLYNFHNFCTKNLDVTTSVWVTGEWLTRIHEGDWAPLIRDHGVLLQTYKRIVLDAKHDYKTSANFGIQLKQRTKDWEVVIPVGSMQPLCELADAAVTLFTDARTNATRIESNSVSGYFVDAETILDHLASFDHKKGVWVVVEESIMDSEAKIDPVKVVKLLDEVKGLVQ